ncbi:MAG: hypothetical protein HZB47_14745 [Nitrosomonadales bacterium]|nr:hypothetical protein [Nitrosomonadales bacterium]
MNKTILLVALLQIAPAAGAEVMNCNVSGESLFNLINLDTESKQAVLTDSYGRNTQGKITLVRDAGNGKSKFNVSLEYAINDTPTHIDMIIVPVYEEEYKVGMAGYSGTGKKKLLDIVSGGKAMCF